ncbi:MAG: acetate kinase [Oscillospiraceae bacterium]|nr:acetate kinase [Oscillospiraceae bacterium]MBR2897892.1 acetate kinase [Oscillospiraceae bacterium]MBR2977086.1 acetate kinase [Oscillospiraceae bacterium]MBR3849055.1 acetate kinase [Oscillospiraceae bacterium]
MNILVINAGSSSLKYQLMDPDTGAVSAKGLCERIGIDGKFTYKVDGKTVIDAEPIAMPTHAEAIEAVLAALVNAEHGVIGSMDEIDAVGHRVLHGGAKFTKSCLVDEACKQAIRECIPLGPLHNPANLIGIEACEKVMPGKPQVAVFDTAFHMTMPAEAYIYALPYEYYEKDQVRRYGFHGTSHRYIAERALALLGREKNPEGTKIINCHLGNGSSLCAIKDGKCVDTTMGLGPLAGIPMGTRCGDIDGTIIEYLMSRYGYDIKEMMNILNKKSGVLGISGVSSDFRDLEAAEQSGNERAKLALDKFFYETRKAIGAYAAAMGGVDAIVFTAGVGENGVANRARVMKGLEYLGAKLDPERNNTRGKEALISTDDSTVKVFVIPTNEELMIAKDTAALAK